MSGEIPLVERPRLHDLLSSSQGLLSYTLRGLAGVNGKPPLMKLSVDGACALTCQRCLSELIYPVSINRQLALQDGSDRFAVDDETDAYDVIEAEAEMDVFALIEDELLLSLPYAPKHQDGKCRSAVEGLQKSSNPFAVLEKLK